MARPCTCCLGDLLLPSSSYLQQSRRPAKLLIFASIAAAIAKTLLLANLSIRLRAVKTMNISRAVSMVVADMKLCNID